LRGGIGADLVFCDVGLEIGALVRGLAAERICTPVVACGIGTDTRRAVEAIRAGAKEYLPLPADPELIAAVLAAVADESHQLVYEDEAMAAVLSLADQIAGSEASILVTGESGTGKEVLARYVHRKSARNDKPFISVNCAAIPENLLESELFGHEKGAFTGAIARRIGKFEEANGGTLLLDEISEMDARLQAKLLRAIQEREIDRVGGTKPVKVDIRIIATSNRDLAEAVKHGTFREDLLYRLNVVNLRLPALRERPKDIRALAHHFARKYAEANGVPIARSHPRPSGCCWAILERQCPRAGETPSIAPCCWPRHRDRPEAIRLPDGTQVGAASAMTAANPACRARWFRPPPYPRLVGAPSAMSSAI
jgi:DNA-binding NtrC family response regulator